MIDKIKQIKLSRFSNLERYLYDKLIKCEIKHVNNSIYYYIDEYVIIEYECHSKYLYVDYDEIWLYVEKHKELLTFVPNTVKKIYETYTTNHVNTVAALSQNYWMNKVKF